MNYRWASDLEELANAPRGKAKEDKLREIVERNPNFLKVLKYGMDPHITFGIQKIPKPRHHDKDGVGFSRIVEELLEPLRTRELTGDKAQTRIRVMLEDTNKLQQKWLPRILQQKLRIGVGAKTVNKVAPGTIFEFSIARGVGYKDLKPRELEGFWFFQPKADGARLVAKLDKQNGVSLLSRTGHVWENFDEIQAKLEAYNKRRDTDYVLYLDGEVVSYVDGRINFQAIQKTMLAKKTKAVVGDLVYMVFDAAEESEWLNPQKNYADRYAFANYIVYDEIQAPNIQMIDDGEGNGIISPSHKVLENLCIEFVEEGWEGLMLRRDEPVKLTHNKSLVKVKLFDDSEATIIGIEEGEGNRAGTTGQLVCLWKDEKLFRIGTGLTQADCEEFWTNKEEYIGQFVNFRYFGETDDGYPRHPVFHGIRAKEDVS